MAIKFKCPKCKTELNVKDEMAGKQGKCPACKSVVTVPAPAAAKARPSATASAAPARKPVVEEEEIIDAEVVEEDEDVVEAEIIDDEPKPKPKPSPGKRDTSPDDFNFIRPADDEEEDTRVTSRRPSRRRDEEEEEDEPRGRRSRGRRDEDEDEDDRPSRRKRASARRSRDEDDDYDDDYEEADDEDRSDRRKKARARKQKQAWKRAGTGLLLNFISMCLYAGSWSVMLLIYLIVMVTLFSGKLSMGTGGFVQILGYMGEGLMVVSWILCIIGCAFLLLSPGKHGEMGLGIATLSVAGVGMLFYLYLRFSLNFSLGGFLVTPNLRALAVVIYFWPLLELSRLTLLALYQWATANSLKEEGLSSSSLVLAILVPCAAFGFVLITYLLGLVLADAKSKAVAYFMLLFVFMELAAWVALLGWLTLNTSSTKSSVDYAH